MNSAPYTIRLIQAAAGTPTPHDGHFVVEFEAARMDVEGNYHGGRLKTSPDESKAMMFETSADAFAFWKTQNGYRPDGKPNRPLCAWTVQIARRGENTWGDEP